MIEHTKAGSRGRLRRAGKKRNHRTKNFSIYKNGKKGRLSSPPPPPRPPRRFFFFRKERTERCRGEQGKSVHAWPRRKKNRQQQNCPIDDEGLRFIIAATAQSGGREEEEKRGRGPCTPSRKQK